MQHVVCVKGVAHDGFLLYTRLDSERHNSTTMLFRLCINEFEVDVWMCVRTFLDVVVNMDIQRGLFNNEHV